MFVFVLASQAMKDSEIVEVAGAKMRRKMNPTAWAIPANAPITGKLT